MCLSKHDAAIVPSYGPFPHVPALFTADISSSISWPRSCIRMVGRRRIRKRTSSSQRGTHASVARKAVPSRSRQRSMPRARSHGFRASLSRTRGYRKPYGSQSRSEDICDHCESRHRAVLGMGDGCTRLTVVSSRRRRSVPCRHCARSAHMPGPGKEMARQSHDSGRPLSPSDGDRDDNFVIRSIHKGEGDPILERIYIRAPIYRKSRRSESPRYSRKLQDRQKTSLLRTPLT